MAKPDPEVQKLQQLLRDAKLARLPFEREAWLNLAFFLGQQYTEWNPDMGSIQTIARRPGEENYPRPVVNKIMHFVRTAHHECLQDDPFPDVLPASDSQQDIADSLVAKAWCEDQADEANADYLGSLSRAALWAVIAGNGPMKWSWDDRKKRLRISTPSFFEIYLDPYAKSFEDCRYVIHSQFLDPEQVFEMYGVDVSKDAIDSTDESKTALLRGMGASPVLRGVTVNELWMRAGRRHPGGRYAVWAGNRLLRAPGDLPYPHLIKHDMLPFTWLGCVERPDSAYYLSPVQFLRPAQMELNKAHAQMLQGRENFTNFKWYIDGALDLQTDPDGSPGQILRGISSVPGLKPEIIQAAALPPTQDIDVLEQGMMHIVGQHEVSQAQVPGRVEAAKAIELLKESDAGALATLNRTIRKSNAVGWFQALELARVFQPEADMVRSYSKEGLPMVKHFRAGDLAPGYRIRTSMATGLARSRANRQDLAIRLWDSKVIQDPEVMADLMEIPLPNMLETRSAAITQARAENIKLADGKAVDANSWDDHMVHLREHNNYRMTQEFMDLSPESKRRFEAHVQGHKRLQKEQIAEQAQLAMLMQGGQPAPVGAPAPTPPPGEEAPSGPQ